MSERPPVSGHPRDGASMRGTGANGGPSSPDEQEQAASGRELAERVAERVYELLQEELRLERERSSRPRSGRWER